VNAASRDVTIRASRYDVDLKSTRLRRGPTRSGREDEFQAIATITTAATATFNVISGAGPALLLPLFRFKVTSGVDPLLPFCGFTTSSGAELPELP